MRLLLSATPSPGNLIPVPTIGRAALRSGHEVALLAPEQMRGIAGTIPVLPVGPNWPELIAEDARRHPSGMGAPGAGANLTPSEVAACLAETRLDMGAADALQTATAWSPDIVVAEASDSFGPLVAAVLHRPWISHGFGVPLPESFDQALQAAAEPIYLQRHSAFPHRTAYLDPWPDVLSADGWSPPADRITIALDPLPADRDGPAPHADLHVLVSFGTQVHETELLTAVVGSILTHVSGRVVVTRGMADDLRVDDDRVTVVDFVPLGALLTDVDVAVTVGGSGTVLGALSRSIPVVILPVLPSQKWVAERVAAQGAGVVVETAEDVGPAAMLLRTDTSARRAARRVSESIAALGTPDQALQRLIGMTATHS